MSIHVEEKGKIRCVVPDRSVNELVRQKFEQLEPLEGVVMITEEATTLVEVPKKVIKPSTCIKTNLDQLKLP